ncbi:MAG: helix-turn-helix domain-containing protein [Myxococcales bacterium]
MPRLDKKQLSASEYLTAAEASAVLRISRNAMYAALGRGEVPGQLRIGNLYRIRKAALLPPKDSSASPSREVP